MGGRTAEADHPDPRPLAQDDRERDAAARRAKILRAMERLFDPPDKRRGPRRAAADGPLAARMRPRTLDEFVGQEHLLGEGSALRAALESGHPHSMVLYGPPGTGKTTLARLAAEHADAAFEELSAVKAGRAEVREVIARARERRRGRARRSSSSTRSTASTRPSRTRCCPPSRRAWSR